MKLQDVAALVRRAALEEILPRYRKVSAHLKAMVRG